MLMPTVTHHDTGWLMGDVRWLMRAHIAIMPRGMSMVSERHVYGASARQELQFNSNVFGASQCHDVPHVRDNYLSRLYTVSSATIASAVPQDGWSDVSACAPRTLRGVAMPSQQISSSVDLPVRLARMTITPPTPRNVATSCCLLRCCAP